MGEGDFVTRQKKGAVGLERRKWITILFYLVLIIKCKIIKQNKKH